MFVAILTGFSDDLVLGVRPTREAAVALCRAAHRRAKTAQGRPCDAAAGKAATIPGQCELGGTYHHTAVLTLDENGDPKSRAIVTKGPDW